MGLCSAKPQIKKDKQEHLVFAAGGGLDAATRFRPLIGKEAEPFQDEFPSAICRQFIGLGEVLGNGFARRKL